MDLPHGLLAAVVAALFASLGAAGCRSTVPSPIQAQAAADRSSFQQQSATTQQQSSSPEPATAIRQDVAPPRTLTLSYADAAKPVVGIEAYATGDGLPPHRTVDL